MRRGLLLLSIISCLGCAGAEPAGTSHQDQRAVTEAILQHQFTGRAERPLFRRQADTTSWFWSDLESWQDRSELKPGTAASFVAANAPGVLHEDWLGSLGVGLISEADFQSHFSYDSLSDLEAGWESLLRGPPECTVVVTMSIPGFSEDGQQALVCIGQGRGGMDGGGGLYLLERQMGEWVVTVALMMWVS